MFDSWDIHKPVSWRYEHKMLAVIPRMFGQRYRPIIRYGAFVRTKSTIPTASTAPKYEIEPAQKDDDIFRLGHISVNSDPDYNGIEMGGIFQETGIFQNSQFQSLSLSEHGSLILNKNDVSTLPLGQHELPVIRKNRWEEKRPSTPTERLLLAGFGDEEELHVNFDVFENVGTGMDGRRFNLINSTTKNNANESTAFRLIRKSHDYKQKASSIDDFKQQVIGDECSVRAFNFSFPVFPVDCDSAGFKTYLRHVNAIDFRYDVYGYEKVVFYQMLECADNIHKLEGLADIDILHEFIKFFSKYSMIRRIFKILEKFDNIGVKPNKDTLHLLIYGLKHISNLKSRQDLVHLYLVLSLQKWKISGDNTTKLLVYTISPPSKDRLSVGRALVNEGIGYDTVKWHFCEDYVELDLTNRVGATFRPMVNFLIKSNVIQDSQEDRTTAFRIYVGCLLSRGMFRTAVAEVLGHADVETCHNWADLVEKSIESKRVLEAIGVINHVKNNRRHLDLQCVLLPVLTHHKAIYAYFTKQKFNAKPVVRCAKDRQQIDVYNIFMKTVVQALCIPHGECAKFFKGDCDPVSDETGIKKQLESIQLWKHKDAVYANFSPLSRTNMGKSDMIRLWNVLELGEGAESRERLAVDPIAFPWLSL